MLLVVVAGGAWLGFLNEISRFEMDVRAALFVAAAPAAQADHLVIGCPSREGIVGGVIADEASAVAHECFEGGFGLVRPLAATAEIAVVRYHYFVGGKVRLEAAHVFALGRRGSDIYLELPGAFQDFFQNRSGGFPVVIILAVDDEDLDGGGGLQ